MEGQLLGHFLPSPCCLSASIVLLSRGSTSQQTITLWWVGHWQCKLPILGTNHECQVCFWGSAPILDETKGKRNANVIYETV